MHGSGQNGSGLGGFTLIVVIYGGILASKIWPWPLLTVPVMAAAALAFSSTFRGWIGNLIRGDGGESPHAASPGWLKTVAFWLALIYSVLCALTIPWQSMQWWLIPICLWAMWFRLGAFELAGVHGSRLNRAVADNMAEFLTVTAVVLAVYTVLLGWFLTWPLDEWLRARLEHLGDNISHVNHFVEHHKPEAKTLFWLIVTIYTARVIGRLFPGLTRATNRLSAAIARGVCWSRRIATASAVAASLTFLAVQTDGPLASVGLALRDSEMSYRHFQSALKDRVDDELREAILRKAWADRPAAVETETAQAAKFIRERRVYENAAAETTRRYRVSPDSPADAPDSHLALTSGKVGAEPIHMGDAANWTPSALKRADAEMENWHRPDLRKDLPESEDPGQELASEEFAEIVPAERLFTASPAIEILKAHLPVFGDLLEVVTSSVSDVTYASMRSAIVKKLTGTRLADKTADLQVMAKREVAAAIVSIHFDWSPFNSEWQQMTAQRLEKYTTSVESAYARVRTQADIAKQSREMRLGAIVHYRDGLLRAVAASVESDVDVARATAVANAVAELEPLAQQWPALDRPTTDQTQQMQRITQILHSTLPDLMQVLENSVDRPDKDYSTAFIDAREELLREARIAEMRVREGERPESWETSPHATLVALRIYCSQRIEGMVGQVVEPSTRAERLRQLLGTQYEPIRNIWLARVSRREAQRKREEIAQREQERKYEEFRRMSEHPKDMI